MKPQLRTTNQNFFASLSELAKKHNVAIITATQTQRDDTGIIPVQRIKPFNQPDIIVVDYIDLLS